MSSRTGSAPIIRVEGLGKEYRINTGATKAPYMTLRDKLAGVARAPFKALGRQGGTEGESMWALRDVNFEIEPGEVVGFVGRNGAGKSTLLKILSRITEPSVGRIELYGRVASLLEVGTGFNMELTGRENVYLNGAILGMSRVEIGRKFDAIVAFSEVEKFIDTPVKFYSSGMYLRLAFAIAAYMEPDILIVDEVLAVGDAEFQKKCLGKMEGAAAQGRTVLFVSHDAAAVQRLCDRALLLQDGRVAADGSAGEIISQYVGQGSEKKAERVWANPEGAPGSEKIRLHAVRVISGGEVTTDVDIQDPVHVEIEFWNFKPDAQITTSIHLLNEMGTAVLATANMRSANLIEDEWFGKPHPVGLYRTVCTLPGNFLNDSNYSVNAVVLTGTTTAEVFVEGAVSFTVRDTGAMREEYDGDWLGVVRPRLAWQTEHLDSRVAQASRERAL